MLFREIERRRLVLSLRHGTVERFRALLTKLQDALWILIFEEVLDSRILGKRRGMERIAADLTLFLMEVGRLADSLLWITRLGQDAQHVHPVLGGAKLVWIATVRHDLGMLRQDAHQPGGTCPAQTRHHQWA